MTRPGRVISRCAQSRGPVAATAIPRPDRDYAGGVILQVNIGAIDQLRRAFVPRFPRLAHRPFPYPIILDESQGAPLQLLLRYNDGDDFTTQWVSARGQLLY